jgi:hypothetical protein
MEHNFSPFIISSHLFFSTKAKLSLEEKTSPPQKERDITKQNGKAMTGYTARLAFAWGVPGLLHAA